MIRYVCTSLLCVCLVFGLLPGVAVAERVVEISDITDVERAYEYVTDVIMPNVAVPTVVELPLPTDLYDTNEFVVYDVSENRFISHYIAAEADFFERSIIDNVTTVPAVANINQAIDSLSETAIDFNVSGQSAEVAVITLTTSEPIKTSGLLIDLAPNVAMPLTVGLKTALMPGDVSQTAISPRRMNSQRLQFPEVTAQVFEITFTHVQPLRISEVKILTQDDDVSIEQKAIRFLAQPAAQYKIYAESDTSLWLERTEAGNLATDEDVLLLEPALFENNARFLPADVDQDGIPDLLDNCVSTANPDQIDINENGRGDVCDDFDRDGRLNPSDNCPNEPNSRQRDEDGDGIGDACDNEESRFTEANPWVPWAGIGTAALVLLVLFALIAMKKEEVEIVEDTNQRPEE